MSWLLKSFLLVGFALATCQGFVAEAASTNLGSDAVVGNYTGTEHAWENVILTSGPYVDSPTNTFNDEFTTDPDWAIGTSWITPNVSLNPATLSDAPFVDIVWTMTNGADSSQPNYFPVLEQNGTLYRKVGNFNADSNGVGTHIQILAGESAWGEILPPPVSVGNGSEQVDPTSNPDFSSGAPTINFGIHQWAGTSGAGTSDNLRTELIDFTADVVYFNSISDAAGSMFSYNAGTTGTAPDPIDQSWIRFGSAGNTSDVSPDVGFGKNAWQVVDDSDSGGGNNRFYRHAVFNAEHQAADQFGWTMTADVRMVDDGQDDTISQHFMYGDGATRYLVWLDLDANKDLVITATGGGTFADGATTGDAQTITTGGTGADDYHVVDVVYDPTTDKHQLLIDNVLWWDDLNGQGNGFNGVEFGAGSSGGQGIGNWHLVKFAVGVPEPSSILILLLGTLGLAAVVRRQR